MKNKEIEELLNELKWYVDADNEPDYNGEYPPPLEWEQGQVKLLLSYIEQLEEELKEEQEENYKQSEWLVKKQKKIEQLENNRDKAIEILSGSYCTYDDVIKILKGTSTEFWNEEDMK